MSRGGARLNAGRPRKTAAQHELAVTVPARPNPNEPRYAVEAPDKPAYIAANAISTLSQIPLSARTPASSCVMLAPRFAKSGKATKK